MVVKCHKSKVSQKENFQGKAFENAKFANIYASIGGAAFGGEGMSTCRSSGPA
jgi:hypothetical protein